MYLSSTEEDIFFEEYIAYRIYKVVGFAVIPITMKLQDLNMPSRKYICLYV